MRKLFILIPVLLAVNACFAQIINLEAPKTYLPEAIQNIKMGEGVLDFQNSRDTSAFERDVTYEYAYIGFKETLDNNALKSAYYKFDVPGNGKNLNRPLYEIRLEFVDADAADAYVDATFTDMYRPSDFAEKEWLLATNKDYFLLVRKYENYVIVAAMMNGTEWGFE